MTIIYNMLKMKKMNGLKIFALVLLSLSKFETMFGMKEKENENEDEINDEYVNKNYYLIDDFGNKITLDNGEDIKFKICSPAEINEMKGNIGDNDILEITEENSNKILVTTMMDQNNEKKTYLAPIPYINEELLIGHDEQNNGNLVPWGFTLEEEYRKEYEENTIECFLVKKIGEDSINNDYILVDTKNNKIEIKDKNIVFKLLTRKKYLELKENLKDPNNYLKNNEGKYILDTMQNPLFFEEENNKLILYVKRLDKDFDLACLDAGEWVFSPNKTNYVEVSIVKKEEIDKIEEKKVEIDKIDKKEGEKVEKKKILKDNDSSKCCCGIC